MRNIVKDLERSAKEIRAEGHAGWGNVCADAIGEIKRLRALVKRGAHLVDLSAGHVLHCETYHNTGEDFSAYWGKVEKYLVDTYDERNNVVPSRRSQVRRKEKAPADKGRPSSVV